MKKNNFLRQMQVGISSKVQKNIRKRANTLINKKEKEEEGEPGRCKNCQCQDLEDWLDCHSKK